MNILLAGNPNVGKSTVFSRLTGVHVVSANFAGSTVEYQKGKMLYNKLPADLIDVPGTYSMHPTNPSEQVATDILEDGDLIINVVDVTNLERNLNLTLSLIAKKTPVIVALNFVNEARHRGIDVDIDELEKQLGVPVVPVVAITGQGIKRLIYRMKEAKSHPRMLSDKQKWLQIGKIVDKVQKITPKSHSLLERLEDLSIRPLTGIPIMLFIMALTFYIIRFIGEGLIGYLFEPLFELYRPLIMSLSGWIGQGHIHDILIGTLINGEIDYVQSLGLLTTGLFVPIGMILPYVFAFYLALGILEDIGYLPRIATILDALMHRLGMHGIAIIPMFLGAGCNVPGAMATRILESPRQRFIAITLMSIAVPCMAQLAMIIGLLGTYGISAFAIFFFTLIVVWFGLGLLLNKFVTGMIPETFIEIPPYRLPYIPYLGKKLWMRVRCFVTEAVPYVIAGVLVVNLLYSLGVIDFISRITAPIVIGILGLPADAVASLVVGFLRKDVAVGMLVPLGLTMKQMIIASVVLTMYFPCIAAFVVMIREIGAKKFIVSSVLMIISTLLVGGTLNLIL